MADADKAGLTQIELKDGDFVLFDPMDSKHIGKGSHLGRAEFQFCPIWRRGKLQEFFIYPLQQRNVIHFYHVTTPKHCSSFSIQSWTHKGIDNPYLWHFSWCPNHRTQSVRVYVPRQSNCFSVQLLATSGVNFDTISDTLAISSPIVYSPSAATQSSTSISREGDAG